MAAAAPALKAAGTNAWPSRLSLRATKTSSGARLRVSMEKPAMGAAGVPSGSPWVAAMRSCHCPSGSDMEVGLREGGAHRLVIGEGQHAGADDLPDFMSLAGDQQNVAGPKEAHPSPDRLGAVGDFAGSGASGQNFRPNGLGPLAARVVVRDDHKVSELGSDAPHHWPFASVPVAAAAEHADDATGRKAAQRLERGLKGIRFVCVVDDDEAAAHPTHDLEAASYALQLGKARQHPACRLTRGDGEPSR